MRETHTEGKGESDREGERRDGRGERELRKSQREPER